MRATLPVDSPLPTPNAGVWRHWLAEVTTRLAPLLLIGGMNEDEVEMEVASLSWRDEPVARFHRGPEAHLEARIETPDGAVCSVATGTYYLLPQARFQTLIHGQE